MGNSVLIVGLNRPGNLESSYGRAFQKIGWSVSFWDPTEALRKVARGYELGRVFSSFVNVEPWLRKANLDLLQLADQTPQDIILIIGTGGVRAGTLAQLKVTLPGTKLFCIYPDSPHNLDSQRLHCLPLFDLVTTSSPAWVDSMRKLGAGLVKYLPFAADTDLHRPVQEPSLNGHGGHSLVFIGNWRTEREKFLEHLVDFDLHLWGGKMWKQRTRSDSPLKSLWAGRRVTDTEFSQVCGRSRILLNILDPITWPGPNMRTFELPACKAFALSQRTPAITELFSEGKNIECFDSVEEARDKIKFYLANEGARQTIAEEAYRFVVQGGHTYVDRARQLLEWALQDARP